MKGFNFSVDELGSHATIEIDLKIYSLTAVFKTAYWQTENFYLFLRRSKTYDDLIEIEIRIKNPDIHQNNLENACWSFCNSLIDFETRQRVISETKSIRDILVSKAFSEGAHHLDPDNLS